MQLQPAITRWSGGHWATRGAKDGWIASQYLSPPRLPHRGGGISAAALTETVRRLAVQKTTPVAAVTRALRASAG